MSKKTPDDDKREPTILLEPSFRAKPEDKRGQALAPHYISVARMLSQYSVFEYEVDHTLWKLAGISNPNQGACLTSQFGSIFARFNALVALVDLLPESGQLVSRINKFTANLHGLVDRRNRAAHDPLYYNRTDDLVYTYRITAKKTVELGTAPSDLDRNQETVQLIMQKREEFQKIKKEIFEHLASLKKPEADKPLHRPGDNLKP